MKKLMLCLVALALASPAFASYHIEEGSCVYQKGDRKIELSNSNENTGSLLLAKGKKERKLEGDVLIEGDAKRMVGEKFTFAKGRIQLEVKSFKTTYEDKGIEDTSGEEKCSASGSSEAKAKILVTGLSAKPELLTFSCKASYEWVDSGCVFRQQDEEEEGNSKE